MGASQSREVRRANELLLQRVRELELEAAPRRQHKAAAAASILPPPYDEAADLQSSPTGVSVAVAKQWEVELLDDPKNRLALAAFSNNTIKNVLANPAAQVVDVQTFNITIPHEGAPVTNQRSSGRCWIFASTNVFRIALMKQYNLKQFELSQAYLFFWDKLEKSNHFLENILDTTADDLDGRLVQTLLSDPVGDGGQWDMIVNLVAKYGLVPQALYPDSQHAKASSEMDRLVTSLLRSSALALRAAAAKGASKPALLAMKNKALKGVHAILTLTLGPPPAADKKFCWEFRDADGKYRTVFLSPQEFSKQLSAPSTVRAMGGTDVHQLFSLVHDPRHEFGTHLTVSRLGNVHEGLPTRYVNVSMPVMKTAAIAMLKHGWPVFFGSDVGKESDSAKGIMDATLYDYELGFNVQAAMSKAERLKVGESAMTHAMVLTGVHVEAGRDVRWRVENSWSDTAGDKGYFVMTGDWMNEWCYQVVVDPSVVDNSITDILKQEPQVLPLWDPMGALA